MSQERERMPSRREERGMAQREPEWIFESPFRTMQRMLSEFGFGRGPLAQAQALMPSVDVWETDQDVMVRADLPGAEPDQVELYTTEDSVEIRGEIKQEHEQREKGMYRTERTYGSFDRVIPLPTEIQPDQAKATFRNGVLEITLPKSQRAKEKVKKVPIETSQQQMTGAKGGQTQGQQGT